MLMLKHAHVGRGRLQASRKVVQDRRRNLAHKAAAEIGDFATVFIFEEGFSAFISGCIETVELGAVFGACEDTLAATGEQEGQCAQSCE